MFARIMPVDDVDHAPDVDSRNGQALQDIARDPRALDFVLALQLGIFRIGTYCIGKFLLGKHLPADIVQ